MKKFLLMLAAIFALSMTATVFTSCGGDDDDDDDNGGSTSNIASVSITGTIDEKTLEIYPDLKLVIEVDGQKYDVTAEKDMNYVKQIPVAKSLDVTIVGNLDASKIIDTEKYPRKYDLKVKYTKGLGYASSNLHSGFTTLGSTLKEKGSHLEETTSVNVDALN